MENIQNDPQNQNKSGNASGDKKPSSEAEKAPAQQEQEAKKEESPKSQQTEQQKTTVPAVQPKKISDVPGTDKEEQEVKAKTPEVQTEGEEKKR